MTATRVQKVKYSPHLGQQAFHAAVNERDEKGRRKYKYFVLNNGRRWGKDRACGMEFIQTFTELDNRPPDASRVPHTHGWVVAPTYKMAAQMWLELKTFWPKSLVKKINDSEMKLWTKRGGLVEVRSAHEPDGLVGVGLDVLWITEAARVPELAWHNLRPMLASPGRAGIAFINSTPKGNNWFARLYWQGQEYGPDGELNARRVPRWWSMTAPTLQNSYLDDEQRQDILNAKLELPEDIYAQEYEAKILDNGSRVFRGLSKVITVPLLDRPKAGRRYVMGVDFGKVRDFTALVVMDRETQDVVYVERFNQLDWRIQIDRIVVAARIWRATKIVVDSTTLGIPIIDFLKGRLLRGLVEGYSISSNKAKVDLIQPLQRAIESEEVHIPNHPVLVDEMSEFEYQISDRGTWTYGAPEGKHDDTVIAIALAYRAASERSTKLKQGYRRLYPGV